MILGKDGSRAVILGAPEKLLQEKDAEWRVGTGWGGRARCFTRKCRRSPRWTRSGEPYVPPSPLRPLSIHPSPIRPSRSPPLPSLHLSFVCVSACPPSSRLLVRRLCNYGSISRAWSGNDPPPTGWSSRGAFTHVGVQLLSWSGGPQGQTLRQGMRVLGRRPEGSGGWGEEKVRHRAGWICSAALLETSRRPADHPLEVATP